MLITSMFLLERLQNKASGVWLCAILESASMDGNMTKLATSSCAIYRPCAMYSAG